MPNPTPVGSPRGWTRLTRVLRMDQAVSYAVAARIWQLIAGLVTSLLIMACFSKLVQGYYFTFWSLLQLQTVVELGTQWAILYVASHEWAKLRLEDHGGIGGDAAALARLANVTRLARNWFTIAALLFVIAAGCAGAVLFSQKEGELPWVGPWLSVVAVAGVGLALSPYISVLEGCNQMATVNRYRLFQAVTGSLVVWSAILLGANLWVALIAVVPQVLWELLLLARFRRFWKSLPVDSKGHISWRREVWPLQWRLAVQSVFRYFAFGLFVPVMFVYDSELAGRMGMTWMVLTAFQQAAFSWVRTRAPTFGALITRQQYRQLDRLFGQVTIISVAVLILACTFFCVGVWCVNLWQHDWSRLFSEKLLDPLPTILFSLAMLVSHLVQCFGVYLRAHKRDPLLKLTVVANSLIGVLVVLLGGSGGALPAAVCLLSVLTLITLPGTTWIWLRCRADWHAVGPTVAG